MTPLLPFSKKEETLSDVEERNELLRAKAEGEDLQLTIAQKQALRMRLEQQGLTVKKDFGGSVKRAWAWFKTH